MNKKQIGNWGERQAVTYLHRRGYIILETNVFSRYGEIDIIAEHPDRPTDLYCIEVKTRKNNDGSAEQATGHIKQLRLKKTAIVYCQKHQINLDRTGVQLMQVSVCKIRYGWIRVEMMRIG